MPECIHERAIEIIEQSDVPVGMINEFTCPECGNDLEPFKTDYGGVWHYREVEYNA